MSATQAWKVTGVQVADRRGGQADDHEPQQWPGSLEAILGVDVAEQGVEAQEGPEHRVCRAGGDEPRQQAAVVEVVTVGQRCGQHRPAQGRGEDRADARPDAQRHRGPAVLVGQVQPSGQQRAEPGRDLRRRAFAAGRTARSDGQRAGHHLHQHRPEADGARIAVHRLDGFVGAVTGGFRGEPGHDERRQQRTGRRHQRNRPRAQEAGRPVAATLSERRREVVARQVAEQKLCGVFQRDIKHDRTEAGNDTDRDAQQEPLAQVARRADRCAEASAGGGGRGRCGVSVAGLRPQVPNRLTHQAILGGSRE